MSKLESFIVRYNGKFIRVYEESEADKVIADLEESHKKEVEQLLIEITKLKAGTEQVVNDVMKKCLVYGEGFVPAEHAMKLVAELRCQKYKRCVALSQEWRSYATFCGMQFLCHNSRGFVKTAEHYTRREFHAWKCAKRWLAIANMLHEEV